MHIFRLCCSILLITSLASCSGIYFAPSKHELLTPDNIALNYQDIWLTSQDNTRIHAWWLPAKASQQQTEVLGTIYFLHGNDRNISSYIHAVSWLPEQGYNVLLIDYRGYGRSSGKATLPEVFLDIQAGLDWLQETQQKKPVYVLGQSLGAAMGAYYFSTNEAAKAQISGLVLDAGFADYNKMLDLLSKNSLMLRLLKYPMRWMLKTDYGALPYMQQLSPIPLLVFHSPSDEVVPFTQGKALYKAAQVPKYFVRSAGQHNYTFFYPLCRKKMLLFMQNKLSTQENNLENSKIGCQ